MIWKEKPSSPAPVARSRMKRTVVSDRHDLDDEHDRVADQLPRVELGEGRAERRARAMLRSNERRCRLGVWT